MTQAGGPGRCPITCRSVAFLARPLSVSLRQEVNSCCDAASLPAGTGRHSWGRGHARDPAQTLVVGTAPLNGRPGDLRDPQTFLLFMEDQGAPSTWGDTRCCDTMKVPNSAEPNPSPPDTVEIPLPVVPKALCHPRAGTCQLCRCPPGCSTPAPAQPIRQPGRAATPWHVLVPWGCGRSWRAMGGSHGAVGAPGGQQGVPGLIHSACHPLGVCQCHGAAGGPRGQ